MKSIILYRLGMATNAEILFEGSYLYFQKENNFSQENFKLVHFPDTETHHIYAEIMSRIETGEFLKMMVRYEMDTHFHPIFLRIEKSLGNRYAVETFKHDLATQELLYTFQNAQKTQEFKRSLNTKHYIASPSFATSAIFTLSRRIDATGRTPITLLSTDNLWDYENPPEEKVIYVEYKSRDLLDFRLNNATLAASHLCLYEHDSNAAIQEPPIDIFLSKHFAIPYQMLHGDQKVVIKNLKKSN